MDPIGVPSEGTDLLAGDRVPEDRLAVPGAGEDDRPSGLNTTEQTESPCPFNERISWPVSVSQSFAVLSLEPVTIRRPSGLNATDQINPLFSPNERTCWPVAASQRISLSHLEVRTSRPSGLIAPECSFTGVSDRADLLARRRIPDYHWLVV